MKKYVNGKYVELTKEEIEEQKKLKEQFKKEEPAEPTMHDLTDAVERGVSV